MIVKKSFIKRMTAQSETAPSIKKMIHTNLAGYGEHHPHDEVHASSITKEDAPFCPREFALHYLLPAVEQKKQFIPTVLQVTFDFGNDAQKRVNEQYLVDAMVGNWTCNSCGTVKKFCKKPKAHCGKAGIKCNWTYNEIRFTSEYSGISGGIDALVNVGKPKLRIGEIKTIAKEQFAKLLAPLAEHTLRTNLYLRLVEESDHPKKEMIDTTEGHVLYIIKGYGCKDEQIQEWGIRDQAMSPFKEFIVKRDDSVTNKLSSLARQVKLFKDGDGGMPEGVCVTAMCDRSKQCAVAKYCFSGKYPKGKKVKDLK